MKIGFIGGGKLAEAMISGLIKAGVAKPEEITVSDIDSSRRELLQERYSVSVVAENPKVVRASDVVILALKPKVLPTALLELDQGVAPKLLITVAAGIPISRVEAGLADGTHLIRVMPNINCAAQASCTAICAGTHATEEDMKAAEKIFGAVGMTFRMEESKMDAVTALSGSGPAYAFIFIEALADGGVLYGLPRSDAMQMAAQTVLGAAKMVLESGLHPAELKDRVASPGGTTIAGIRALEEGGLRAAVLDAVSEGYRRSKELSI